ncbi:hypothetical protein [Quadrisphaera sp. DSM 44207]|nr:hypothetical protein [Quadrisphaera sp. DSM 44207]SDQ38543.1 hypothetical protein SAMN05428996_1494 [Quadrisphaera sp. DSM 44207]
MVQEGRVEPEVEQLRGAVHGAVTATSRELEDRTRPAHDLLEPARG